MRRREFITVLGGVTIGFPLTARSQQPAIPVIGYLGAESPARFASRLEAFRRGLRATGFDEGRNVTIEYRWAEGHNDRLPTLAAELVSRQLSVIAAPGSVASALAAKAATRMIPIVFEIGADPVAAGLVAGLSRPEDNITGVTSLNWAIAAKRLQLLREVAPTAGSFAVLVNPSNPKNAEAVVADLQTAAKTLGCDLHVLHASTEGDFGEAFSAFGKLGAGGLVIANDASFVTRSEQLAALTLRDGVAAVHQSREFAAAGGLMSYGGSLAESHGQAGAYVGADESACWHFSDMGDVRLESVMRTKADVRRPLQIYGFTPWMPAFAGHDDNHRAAAFLPEQAKSSTARKPGLYRIAAAVEFAQVQPHTV